MKNRHYRYLETLLCHSKIDFWEWDLSSDFIYFPAPMQCLDHKHGISELSPQQWENNIHSEDRHIVRHAIGRVASGRSDRYQAEFRLLNVRGAVVWVRSVGVVSGRDENNLPVFLVGIQQDVTDFKQA